MLAVGEKVTQGVTAGVVAAVVIGELLHGLLRRVEEAGVAQLRQTREVQGDED